MGRQTVQVMLTALILSGVLGATVINVPSNQPTIQAAVGVAGSGDTVLVAPGRYWENINFQGKGIVLASHFLLNPNPALVESTIIDGSQPQYPDSASCLLLYRPTAADSVDTMAAVIGFTITGGRGTVWPDKYVSGTANNEGGGILIENWSPRIYYNRIIGNQAVIKTGCFDGAGGGLKCTDGHPRIRNNLIALNRTSDHAGGVLLWHAGGILENNLIAYNICGGNWGGGGGLCLDYCSAGVSLVNNTIAFNEAGPNNGGGIHNWNSDPLIVNCILWGNEAQQILVQGGSPRVSFSDIQGGWSGTGNIDSDPAFMDAEMYLGASSPAIDAGNDSIHYNDLEDPVNPGQARWPSRGMLRNDLGAYGGPGAWDGYHHWPPFVKGCYPVNGQMRVEYNQELRISFSRPMDTASVFCRLGNSGLALYKIWNSNYDTLILQHPESFLNFTRYWLCLDSAWSLNGERLIPAPDSIWFKTRDTVRPRLVATQPYHGQSGVATNALIKLWFSKAVNKNTLSYIFSDTSYHFTLYQTYDSVITLGHVGHPFDGGITYTLEITSFQDSVGNPMGQLAAPNPFSFTTVGSGVEGESRQTISSMVFDVFPNPSDGTSGIIFCLNLSSAGPASLSIYDVSGRRVATILDDRLDSGIRRIKWNGRGAGGGRVGAGCYFCLLRTQNGELIRRIVVTR